MFQTELWLQTQAGAGGQGRKPRVKCRQPGPLLGLPSPWVGAAFYLSVLWTGRGRGYQVQHPWTLQLPRHAQAGKP